MIRPESNQAPARAAEPNEAPTAAHAGQPLAVAAATSQKPSSRLAPRSDGGPPAARPPLPNARAAEPLSAEPAADNIDLHAIWYSPSALQPASSRSTAFQRELATSYLQMVDSMHGAAPNVQAHLWTDRVNEFALHLPMVGPNGAEIEIPHTMLRTARVTVHPERDLHALIDAIADPAVRATVKKLHDHPAGENIGLRADILRQIVTTFFRRQASSGRSLNAYADRDTLANIGSVRDWAAVGDDTAPPQAGLDHAKMTIRALARSLDTPERPTGVIPEGIQSTGYASRFRENDLIAAVPGAELAVSVTNEMLTTLDNVLYSGPISEAFTASEIAQPELMTESIRTFERHIPFIIANLASIRTGIGVPVQNMDPKEALTAFLLAERVRGLQPQLQAHIRKMEAEVHASNDVDSRIEIFGRINALQSVYGQYMSLIALFVNLGSYTPQVARANEAGSQGLNDFFYEVVGAIPRIFGSDSSWQGSLKSAFDGVQAPGASFEELMAAGQVILEMLRQEPSREV